MMASRLCVRPARPIRDRPCGHVDAGNGARLVGQQDVTLVAGPAFPVTADHHASRHQSRRNRCRLKTRKAGSGGRAIILSGHFLPIFNNAKFDVRQPVMAAACASVQCSIPPSSAPWDGRCHRKIAACEKA